MDGHVHYYRCYGADVFLDSAAANFEEGARERGLPPDAPAVAMMTEVSGEGWFDEWRSEGLGAVRWTAEPTAEACSLAARRDDGRRILLVAGRQIATAEGLEVLALATGRGFADGDSLEGTLASVAAADAVPVLPWGFGKWWFHRGDLVCGALGAAAEGKALAGDSAGRPRGVPLSRPLREARRRGVPVLPGTDPLPIPAHSGQAGSYGFVLESGLDPDRPAESLRGGILDLAGDPPRFGRRASWLGFLGSQVALRLGRGRAA